MHFLHASDHHGNDIILIAKLSTHVCTHIWEKSQICRSITQTVLGLR